MLKMKEACQITGLTERAIRLYIEQNLIKPEIREGNHNKAYFFCEEDVERLKDISILRNAGFSISDIKRMLENPANIPALVGKKEAEIEQEISHMKSIQEALKYLSIQEHSDVRKLANAMEPRSAYVKEPPKYKKPRWMKVLIWLVICLLFLTPLIIQMKETLFIALFYIIGLLGGVSFPIMAIGYILYCIKSGRMKNTTTGKVVAIVSNEGIEDYIGGAEIATLRQLITFGFLRWNEMRPDHWFPLIQFEIENGQLCTSTFRYGGFKHSWTIDEKVDIAWEDERIIYPKNTKWLLIKACGYLLTGMGMLVISFLIYSYFIK